MRPHSDHTHEAQTLAIYHDLIEKMPSRRAVARALGISHHTLQHRLENPETIRRESYYAACWVRYLIRKVP